MIVLGINAYHGDASAALFRDGRLLAAVEEERFTRVKHAAGFPSYAVRCRLQTVSSDANPLYHELIGAFDRLTGVLLVLNTSFNESEPIVNTPEQALDCFSRTGMDTLVLGPFLVE